ncbi:MAG: hypothetical protein KDM91_19440 [Verrucomicrobiae bacterium]|nr:hypothetical protein [Verrucomicrobiae bacterium]
MIRKVSNVGIGPKRIFPIANATVFLAGGLVLGGIGRGWMDFLLNAPDSPIESAVIPLYDEMRFALVLLKYSWVVAILVYLAFFSFKSWKYSAEVLCLMASCFLVAEIWAFSYSLYSLFRLVFSTAGFESFPTQPP